MLDTGNMHIIYTWILPSFVLLSNNRSQDIYINAFVLSMQKIYEEEIRIFRKGIDSFGLDEGKTS